MSKSVLHVEVLRFGLCWRSLVRLFVYLNKKTLVKMAPTLLCNSVKKNLCLSCCSENESFQKMSLPPQTSTDNVCMTGGSV